MMDEQSDVQKALYLVDFVEEGLPTADNFRLTTEPFDVDEAIRQCPKGGVVLQNLALSADPYMRLAIRKRGYIDQMEPGQVIKGVVAGKVIASRTERWKVGDLYGGMLPFQTYVSLSSAQLKMLFINNLTPYITEDRISWGVGVLGLAGSTAYAAIVGMMQPQPKQTIYISGAAGAVGSCAGMLAKNVCDLRVIGSCGGPAKCSLIREKFGFDVAIDYKMLSSKEDYVQALKTAAPEGIDFFLDNVGGPAFEAGVDVLRLRGQAVISGQISHYLDSSISPVSVSPMKLVYGQQRIQGVLCSEWLSGQKGAFLPDMGKWIAEGKIWQEETVFEGMENWVEAFQSLFTGNNVGKVVVLI